MLEGTWHDDDTSVYGLTEHWWALCDIHLIYRRQDCVGRVQKSSIEHTSVTSKEKLIMNNGYV